MRCKGFKINHVWNTMSKHQMSYILCSISFLLESPSVYGNLNHGAMVQHIDCRVKNHCDNVCVDTIS